MIPCIGKQATENAQDITKKSKETRYLCIQVCAQMALFYYDLFVFF